MHLHKYFSRLLLSAAIIGTLSACSTNNSSGSGSYTEFTDTIHATGGFCLISNSHGEQLLEVYNPWQGSTADTSRVVIPADGFNRLVCMSTTHLAMLEKVHALDRVVGVSGMEYITIPEILERKNEIADVGYDGAIDYEKLLAQKPDLVLLYGVSGPSGMEQKLKELGINYVYIADYLAADPIERAEWLVALAAIAGVSEDTYDKTFAAIVQRYNDICAEVQKNVTEDERPSVMLNAPYSSTWYMPSASSYLVRLLEDSGANYIYKDQAPEGNASTTIDIEQASLLVNHADFWLFPGQATDLKQLQQLAPKVKFGGEVWNVTPDYWAGGSVNPDVVLTDLVGIFHPNLQSGRTPQYFYRLK
jgi:iron complex transport system substrate-binding protein